MENDFPNRVVKILFYAFLASLRARRYSCCAEIIVMIKLTRLDGEPFVLNAELIRYIEARPDTFVTLTSGERVVVTETMDEVVERAVTYQQTKNLFPSSHPTANAAG